MRDTKTEGVKHNSAPAFYCLLLSVHVNSGFGTYNQLVSRIREMCAVFHRSFYFNAQHGHSFEEVTLWGRQGRRDPPHLPVSVTAQQPAGATALVSLQPAGPICPTAVWRSCLVSASPVTTATPQWRSRLTLSRFLVASLKMRSSQGSVKLEHQDPKNICYAQLPLFRAALPKGGWNEWQ